MSEWKARRFWDAASVETAGAGWAVRLDGKPVLSPGKTELIVPSEALAQKIAAEWDAQDKVIDPLSMPLTRAANTAMDKAAPQLSAVADELAGYGGTDLLCYRAEGPEGLVARQSEGWDPLLDWAEATYGARLSIIRGVMPEDQPFEALQRLRGRVGQCDAWQIVALSEFVTLSGSLILGLAVLDCAQSAQAVWPLSRIDEDWQAEQWGADAEEAELVARKRESFLQAERYLHLLQA